MNIRGISPMWLIILAIIFLQQKYTIFEREFFYDQILLPANLLLFMDELDDLNEKKEKEKKQGVKVLILNKYGEIPSFEKKKAECNFKFYHSLDQDYHLIWIIPTKHSSKNLSSCELTFIKKQYEKGAGIFIWADDNKFIDDPNKVLSELKFSFRLIGSGYYPGRGILMPSKNIKTFSSVFDCNNPVSSGLNKLNEGITPSYPDKSVSELMKEGFKVFANSSPYHYSYAPTILYKNATQRSGGIWIDTAFTKLFPETPNYDDSNVTKYLINASLYIRKKNCLS